MPWREPVLKNRAALLVGLVLALWAVWSSPVRAGDLPRRLVDRWGIEFTLIPAGEHRVCGGPEVDEQPGRAVRLGAYYLSTTELTRDQWRAITGRTDRYPADEPGDLPANGLSLGDGVHLTNRLNQIAGRALYRLPREVEWEAACRLGGSADRGALPEIELSRVAWWRGNSQGRVHPVGRLAPNRAGLFDMLGNVYEWCLDYYTPQSCPGRAQPDPNDSTRGLYHVLRGGSFYTLPPLTRCGWRFFQSQTARHPQFGLRLLRLGLPPIEGDRAVE